MSLARQLIDSLASSVTSSGDSGGVTKPFPSVSVAFADSPVAAANHKFYLVDTGSGAVTVNLPAGSVGDRIGFGDAANNFATNSCTVLPNGVETIAGQPSLVLDGDLQCVVLRWAGSQWVYESAESFNDAVGFTDPMTTRGDLIIRDATNTTARLGIGSNGQVLTSDGTDVSWAAPAIANPADIFYQSVEILTYSDGGTTTMDNGAFNAFGLTANGTSTTIAHSNVPTTGNEYYFRLHLTWTAGAITWPSSWTKGMNAPTATGDYIIHGVTIDGGTSFAITLEYL